MSQPAVHFEFATATRILFGAGSLTQVGPAARDLGSNAFVVTGSDPERARPLLDVLSAEGLRVTTFPVKGEPSVQTALDGVTAARAGAANLVIGFGGGAALDLGKAVAALMTNPGYVYDYLEVVGRGDPLTHPAAPYIAIPTTAGTGSEVTRNAVLSVPERRVKVSLRSPLMLPRLAIIDPELTLGLPPDVTATTGLDALSQLIEPFVSATASPLTDAICREGLQRAATSLQRAWRDGGDIEARTGMALASLCGGLALANAKLGAVHGLAAPFGGMFAAPHGAVCAWLLPQVMSANVRALRVRQPDSPALARYIELARILTGRPSANAEAGITWVRDLVTLFGIPPLSTYGLSPADFPELIAQSQRASSMKGNPVALSEAELQSVLEHSI